MLINNTRMSLFHFIIKLKSILSYIDYQCKESFIKHNGEILIHMQSSKY